MSSVNKEDALARIAAIAAENDLTLDDIGGALTHRYSQDKSGALLVRNLGYLGATLIFGGLALLIGMQWDIFGSAARVIITYGTGLAAFVMGVVTLRDLRYSGASTPLFLASALLQPTGMFVFLNEYASGNDFQLAALIVFGLCAVQYLATFFTIQRTALLFFGYLFFNAALGIWMQRVGTPGDWIALGMSLSILMVTWRLDQSVHRGIAPFWYCIGSVGLLAAAFDMLGDTPWDILLLVLSINMMFLSVRIRSRTLLLVNTVGLLCVLGYYTDQYFKDMVGWPLALMIMGAMLVGTSAWAVKLNRKIKDAPRR